MTTLRRVVIMTTFVFSTVGLSIATGPNVSRADPLPITGRALFEREGGPEICSSEQNGKRGIAVDWRMPHSDAPLPLFIFMSGAGGSTSPLAYPKPWPFLINTLWGNVSELPGAITVIVRAECLHGVSLESQPYVNSVPEDLFSTPRDLQAVFDSICGHEADGFANSLVSGSPIPLENVECSRVALSGISGGGITALQTFNDCYRDLSLFRTVDAVAARVAGFLPPEVFDGACPEEGEGVPGYAFETRIPVFQHAGFLDEVVPFSLAVGEWNRVRPPKYLYVRDGGHNFTSALLSGNRYAEALIEDFFRHYLLKIEGADVDFGSGYPDGPFPEDTCYLYEGLPGKNLADFECDAITSKYLPLDQFRLSFKPWNRKISRLY